jgi:hypothetical protein
MRKYKIRFSILSWSDSVPQPIARLQVLTKTIMGSITGLTFMEASANTAIYVGMAGLIIDYVFHCITIIPNEEAK